MGTRHLICAVSDNKYRIAQYGQWAVTQADRDSLSLPF